MSTQEKYKSAPNAACGTRETSPNMLDGRIVSLTGDKLVMQSEEGEECCHTVARDALVTCDDAVCETEDLKVGSRIRVTTKKDDRNVATCVEGLDKKAEFAPCR